MQSQVSKACDKAFKKIKKEHSNFSTESIAKLMYCQGFSDCLDWRRKSLK